MLAVLVSGCSTSPDVSHPADTAMTVGCNSNDFSYSVGITEGAAGTGYTTLIFRNIGKGQCILAGTPFAQPLNDGEAVGPSSTRNEIEGRGDQVTIEPGERASILYAVATASNYPPEECVPAESDAVKIVFSSELVEAAHVFTLPGYQVCTRLSSTFVSGVVAGENG